MASSGPGGDQRRGGPGAAPTPAGHGHPHDHDHDHDHDGHDHDHRPSGEPPRRRHDHDHDHDHAHDFRGTPLRRLVAAFVLTAGFMVVEAVVGWTTNFLALLADAGHMLADAAALLLAIIAQRIASQARTRARTYGHRRAEVLAAFANGIALGVIAIGICIKAAQRWHDPPEVDGVPAAIVAGVGLVVNIVCAFVLGSGTHGHNVNTRAALAHVITDALGSVGALAAGLLVITLGWRRADPVISVAIGLLVLWGGYRLVRDTSRVLMEGSPVEIDIEHIEETLRGVPGVAGFHDLHVWSISDGFDVLTVHVVLEKGYHGTEVVDAVSRRLRERHKLTHCTIQPEPAREEKLYTLGRRPAG